MMDGMVVHESGIRDPRQVEHTKKVNLPHEVFAFHLRKLSDGFFKVFVVPLNYIGGGLVRLGGFFVPPPFLFFYHAVPKKKIPGGGMPGGVPSPPWIFFWGS